MTRALKVWTGTEYVTVAGVKGDAATLTAGTTTTSPAGSNALVTNSGTVNDAVFDFSIPRGNPGEQGPIGASAYEVAVANGFVGTEQEWLDSLQGEQGVIGVSGDLTYDSQTQTISFSETYSTPGELLTGILTVDGATSGLDADLLDAQHGAYYLDYNNFTNTPAVPSTTTDLAEGTNLYYTTTRFDSAFATKTTDGLAEGLVNLYHSDERVDDRVANLLVAGDNITLSYNDVANTLTITGQPGYTTTDFNTDFATKSTTNLTEGTNLYFTDERVDDRVAALVVGGTNITTVYDDVANTLTLNADSVYTTTDFNTDFAAKDTDDLSEGITNLYYTDLRADQVVIGRVTKTFVDGLNVDADTLDGVDSTGFATSAQGALADTALQPAAIGTSVQAYSAVLDSTTASYTTAEQTKLSGIEANATADQTASEILTALSTVDGATSGLDADLLDAQEGAYYLDYNNFTNTPAIPPTDLGYTAAPLQGTITSSTGVDVVVPAATTTDAGLMINTDKQKVDQIADSSSNTIVKTLGATGDFTTFAEVQDWIDTTVRAANQQLVLNVQAGTHAVTYTGPAAADGFLTLTGDVNLQIVGTGSGTTTLQVSQGASSYSNVFYASNGASLTLRDITVESLEPDMKMVNVFLNGRLDITRAVFTNIRYGLSAFYSTVNLEDFVVNCGSSLSPYGVYVYGNSKLVTAFDLTINTTTAAPGNRAVWVTGGSTAMLYSGIDATECYNALDISGSTARLGLDITLTATSISPTRIIRAEDASQVYLQGRSVTGPAGVPISDIGVDVESADMSFISSGTQAVQTTPVTSAFDTTGGVKTRYDAASNTLYIRNDGFNA